MFISFVIYTGGDLHYQLTQRGTFTEAEVRFYAAEIALGLDHMHSRNIVYRDLKVSVKLFLFCFSKTYCLRPLQQKKEKKNGIAFVFLYMQLLINLFQYRLVRI